MSAVVRDITAQGMTPGSFVIWEGCNSVNTCPNGTSEESIGINTQRVDANGVVAQ